MAAPDLILHSGVVRTVDPRDTAAEAVAITDGLISAVGSEAEIRASAGPETRLVDLAGRTLVPGFVDAHSHVSMGAPFIAHAALQPPPTGAIRTVDDILDALRAAQERNRPAPGSYIVGWGYYPEEMDDAGALTADILDRAFPDHRVIVAHISAHGGVVNTRVLDDHGYVEGVADPEGGTIVRYAGSRRPNGVLWETAWMPVAEPLQQYDDDALLAMLAEYARWGITTVQDGAASMAQIRQIRSIAEGRGLPVDVRSLVVFTELHEALAANVIGTTSHGHTVQGVKLILDGSPQGRTAHVTEEYLTGGPGGQDHWHGITVIDQPHADALVDLAYRNGIQVFAHVNGDAAIDSLLKAHRAAVAAGAAPSAPTIPIHSQVMRPEQLDSYVEAGFAPSMFTVHTYLFGDTHIRNLGRDRAFGISPMRGAIDRGLRPTNHSDYPVTPLNPLLLLWSSVARRSSGGVVLGEDERITPAEALRALTIDAAHEHGCEDDRGSIEVGKLADLVVLDADPLTVDVDAIRDIAVLATYKRGREIPRR